MNSNEIISEAYRMIANQNNIIVNRWVSQEIFNWHWWLGVMLFFIPWIVWIKIRDKKHTSRLLFVGLVAAIVAISIDNIGLALDLWYYSYKLTPICTIALAWDYGLFPVGIMLIIQLNPQINPYIKAFSFALITAFITEPFFIWIGMYHIIHWKFWYSFIIYVPLYLFFNYIYNSKSFLTHVQQE